MKDISENNALTTSDINKLFLSVIPEEVIENWNTNQINVLDIGNIYEPSKLTDFFRLPLTSIFFEKYQSNITVQNFRPSLDHKDFCFIWMSSLNPSDDSKNSESNNQIILECLNNLIKQGYHLVILNYHSYAQTLKMNIAKNIIKRASTFYELKHSNPFLNKLAETTEITILKENNEKETLADFIKEHDNVAFSMELISRLYGAKDSNIEEADISPFIVKYNANHEGILDESVTYHEENHDDINNVTFENLPGIPIKTRLKLNKVIKDFSADNKRRPDDGVILYGPPGTGKTLIASAIAHATKRNIVYSSFADWQSSGDGHMGSTLKAMKNAFNNARQKAPSIIFIDEIDSIGSRNNENNLSRYMTSIINSLLEEIQGCKDKGDVVVIAATNFIDFLDPALKRKGRLGTHIKFHYPDYMERTEILHYYLKSDKKDCEKIAHRIGECSPADIKSFSDNLKFVQENTSKGIMECVDIVIEDYIADKYPRLNHKTITYNLALGVCAQAFIMHTLFPSVKIHYLTVKPGLKALASVYHDKVYENTTEDKYNFLLYILADKAIRTLYQNMKIKSPVSYRNIVIDDYGAYSKQYIEHYANEIMHNGFDKRTLLDTRIFKTGHKAIKTIVDMKEVKLLKKIPGHIGIIANALEFFTDASSSEKSILNKAEKEVEKLLSLHIDALIDVAKELVSREEMTQEEFLDALQRISEKHYSGLLGKIKRHKAKLH